MAKAASNKKEPLSTTNWS